MAPYLKSAPWHLAATEGGACVFIAVLVVSALFDATVWTLHILQALIYVAVIMLARRHSAWGFGAGFTVAVLWNGANLFVTGFIAGGLAVLVAALRTGQVSSPGLLLVLVGAIGHFLMIAGCVASLVAARPKRRQWAEFVGGGVLAFVALVLISPLRTHEAPRPLDIAQRNPALKHAKVVGAMVTPPN